MSEATDSAGGLAGKMAKVMLELDRIEKGGTHGKHRYAFATADDIFQAVRKRLGAHGVGLFPSVDLERTTHETFTANGTRWTVVYMVVDFELVDSESGERRVMHWLAEGRDPSDKAFSKAYTMVTKTWARSTFLVSTGDPSDDADFGDHETDGHAPAPPEQPRETAEEAKETAEEARKRHNGAIHAMLGEAGAAKPLISAFHDYVTTKARVPEWSELTLEHLQQVRQRLEKKPPDPDRLAYVREVAEPYLADDDGGRDD